ncbi:MAG: lamin tail domain-containing protein [Chloroflexaceae bacterium]|nr:lamin tail domain-containing protein [Chloroflexaceae bacterium]
MPRARQGMPMRRFHLASMLALVLATLASLFIPSAPAQAFSFNPAVVISQVYGGGGNSGATFRNDFIEIFNRSSSPVSLNGWSVQYASATGSTWQRTNLTNITLQPGQYYLIEQAAGAGGTVGLPTPDAIGTIPMSATAGKVALVNTVTTLAGTCPSSDGTVVDFVGYGSGVNCSELTSAPAPSNTNAVLRVGNGCIDTNSNNTDFNPGAPTPRNTAAALAPCGTPPGDSAPSVSSTTPANGATNVAVTANLTVTFSEPVTVAAGGFTLACASAPVAFSQSGGPTNYTLDPSSDLPASTSCTLTVVAALVTDQDSDDPPDTLVADVVVFFSTVAPAPEPTTRIRDIQGAAHISPLVTQVNDNTPSLGATVTNVPGIVTVVRANGFYMQDATPDSNPATSEGIFVFTGSAPGRSVGDEVRVSGQVSEFRGGCTSASCTPTSSAWNNLTITQIGRSGTGGGATATLVSSGNPLPAPTVIGVGGRVPPTSMFASNGAAPTNTIETTSYPFNPESNGLDFYESLEGMRVQVNNPVVVGPTSSFGEIVVLADNGTGAGLRTPRGGLVITPTDFNPERIILDDSFIPANTMPQVNVGDTFTAPIVGMMDYSFANFKVQVTEAPTRVDNNLQPETTTLVGGNNRLTVGTFNIENFAAATVEPARRDAVARIIVTNMAAPDIVALQEVQDNNGPTNDGTVDAAQSYQTLIDAIVAQGGPTYQFRQINPVNNADGGQPGANIRVGFLFRSDRGLRFVDRAAPAGTDLATTGVTVVNNAGAPELAFSPGRIDPTNSAFDASRKPLVGEFLYNDNRIFVINNHFNSKGGDQPLSGRFQPPTRSTEVQRHQQAQIVNTFVDSILAVDANADVIVLGDLNDFQFSETLNIVRGVPGGSGTPVLLDPKLSLPAERQYTYIFEGNSQVLDSLLYSNSLQSGADYDTVHVNTEFTGGANASDHDPSVARFFRPDRIAPDTVLTVNPANPTNSTSASFGFSGSDNLTPAANLTFACSLDGAAFAPCSSPVSYDNLSDGTHTFAVQAVDEAGNVDPTPATVTWLVDTIAPTLSGTPTTNPNGAGWYNGDVTIAWSCADAGAGVAACPENSSISGEGVNLTATASVSDRAGNRTTATSAPPVSIDRTAPTTTSSVRTLGGGAAITLSASDSLSGVAGTQYSINDGAPQPYSLPFLITGPGQQFSIAFFSSDAAGNVETTQTLNITVGPANQSVRPVLECVVDRGAGWNPATRYVARFGYLNENAVAVIIAAGQSNRFIPGPVNRGQTTNFLPGRQRSSFSVEFNGNNLVWALTGPDGRTRTSTASSGSARCP